MSAKRFYASRAREALEMVRNEFGSEANIISNKMVNGWSEIIATRGTLSDTVSDLSGEAEQMEKTHPSSRSVTKSTTVAKSETPTSDTSLSLDDLMSEIRKMKRTFESQLSEMNWATNSPVPSVKQSLIKSMLNAGFGVAVSRRLADRLPSDFSLDQAKNWAKQVLSKNICLAEPEQDFFERGGVFSLIGPTGVGKTTTIAKIAARFVQSHGAEKLALITTDAYRVGGYEQLKIFGKILGVIVHCVKDQEELNIALREFKHKHLVLIDTAGMSQRDRMAMDQLEMISDAQTPIRKILCLNATGSLDTLDDVVKRFSLKGVDGCVITKLDEAITIGGVLNIAMQYKLPVHYTTDGQRVPQDILTVKAANLIAYAFDDEARRAKESEYLNDDIATKIQMNFIENHSSESAKHV